MIYNPEVHHRRSIRLPGYDYAQTGAYFITLCTYKRECMFGEVVDSQMRINNTGNIILKTWEWLNQQYGYVELDETAIMPNHLHGILIINQGRGGSRTARRDVEDNGNMGVKTKMRGVEFGNMGVETKMMGGSRTAPTKNVGRLIGAFKTVSTKQISEIRNTPGVPVWQRNYYEHIIRDDNDLNRVREYIVHNPSQWDEDENNLDMG